MFRRNSEGKGTDCKTKNMNKGKPYKEVRTDVYWCKLCKESINGNDEVLKHCATHLEEIRDNGYTEGKERYRSEETPIMRALMRGGRPGSSNE